MDFEQLDRVVAMLDYVEKSQAMRRLVEDGMPEGRAYIIVCAAVCYRKLNN